MAAACMYCRQLTVALVDAFTMPAAVNPEQPQCTRSQCVNCGALLIQRIARPAEIMWIKGNASRRSISD